MQPQVAHAPSNSVLRFLRHLNRYSRHSTAVSASPERPAKSTHHQPCINSDADSTSARGSAHHHGPQIRRIGARVSPADSRLGTTRGGEWAKYAVLLEAASFRTSHPPHSRLSHTSSRPPEENPPTEPEAIKEPSTNVESNPPPLITGTSLGIPEETEATTEPHNVVWKDATTEPHQVVWKDPKWVRDLISRISDDNVDGAEELWHLAKERGKQVHDLRRTSKELMKAFNLRNRWLDTFRFFKWNEDASQLEDTASDAGIPVIKREDVGIYLAELDRRGRIQEIERQKQAEMSCLLGTEIQRLQTMPETLPDDEDEFTDYLESLKQTAARMGRLPKRYSERVISEEELEAALNEWSESRGPENSTGQVFDGQFLDLCFKALLARLDNERLLTLFYQYQLNTKFTPQTWEYVIAAYINIGQLQRAQGILRYAVFRHYPLSHTCFSQVLYAVRKYGGSWDKQVRYFKWLEKITNTTVPEIYHIMLESAIERGLTSEAEFYFSRMAERGLQHTAKTLGGILSAQARVHNWDALRKTLQLMDEKGLQIPTGSFNAVLDAYASTGSLADTEEFFLCGMEREIVPNAKTYNIMIKACVYSNGAVDEDLLGRWLQKMVDAGFKPSAYTFNMVFDDLRRNFSASAAVLRRVYQDILRLHTTDSVLDEVSKTMLLKTQHKDAKDYPETYRQIRTDFGADLRNQDSLALLMASAIEVGNSEHALALWKAGLKGRSRPSFQVIVNALRACFISTSEAKPISWILMEAKKFGMDIPPSIVLAIKHSTRKFNIENTVNSDDFGFGTTKLDKAIHRIEEAYKFFDKHSIPVTHHLTVQTANYLINAGRPAEAIQLMHRVAISKWGLDTPFDIVGTSVILKGYCVARDLKGVQWAVDWVISHNKNPTRAMMILLDNLLKHFISERKEKEGAFVQNCIHMLREHRERLKEEAGIRGSLLVDFIQRTIGVHPLRRYSSNWPLVTRKRDANVGITFSPPHWNQPPPPKNDEGNGSMGGESNTHEKSSEVDGDFPTNNGSLLPRTQLVKVRRKKIPRRVLTLPELEALVASESIDPMHCISSSSRLST
ncbi:hypothetical protein DFH27DRAFT_532463 [Peziza echinospora]|nr:hypothetical protein DFH27DRAFT_532463 [Peziza echinospora]